MDAVYQRIAGEIRERIDNGELRPGDRVPSTREITVTWRVAMATATKVLFALREEGLVRAVPGVGTVVADGSGASDESERSGARPVRGGRRGRASASQRSGEPDLTGERVVRTAISIADAEGLGALSMRRVAAQLGVATMSLYRYVPGKDDLVLRMVDEALGDRTLPESPPDGWRARLEVSARLQWALFQEHPWLAGALSMTRPQLLPNAVAHTEWALAALDGHGFGLEEMLQAAVTLFGYVRGVAVNIEPEVEQRQHTGITDDEWMARQESVLADLVSTGRFPVFARMAETGVDLDLGTLFEFGLARMLDGIGEWISDRAVLTEGRIGM
jgi:AcrR family transcriptional regulator